ncbi:MAG TPA: ion channel [Solirubrobacteraceae bacterium]
MLFPFMEGSHARRAVFAIFSIAVLGLVVMTVRRSPALTWVALLLGVPAIALRIIEAAYGSDVLLPYSAAPEAGLYFYAAGALIAYTLADHDVTRDELFAVGAIFTLLAWGFASVYTVSQAIESGSYLAATDPMGERTWVELLLLSFTTLSNIGVGDVVPIKPFARGLVMIEQLAGLALIAILIARLVGLTVSWRRSATEADRR